MIVKCSNRVLHRDFRNMYFFTKIQYIIIIIIIIINNNNNNNNKVLLEYI